jgi:hypothetical protein
MKKTLSLILTVSLVLSACGRTEDPLLKRSEKFSIIADREQPIQIPINFFDKNFESKIGKGSMLLNKPLITFTDFKDLVPQSQCKVVEVFYYKDDKCFPIGDNPVNINKEGVNKLNVACENTGNTTIGFHHSKQDSVTPTGSDASGTKGVNTEKSFWQTSLGHSVIVFIILGGSFVFVCCVAGIVTSLSGNRGKGDKRIAHHHHHRNNHHRSKKESSKKTTKGKRTKKSRNTSDISNSDTPAPAKASSPAKRKSSTADTLASQHEEEDVVSNHEVEAVEPPASNGQPNDQAGNDKDHPVPVQGSKFLRCCKYGGPFIVGLTLTFVIMAGYFFPNQIEIVLEKFLNATK